MSSATIRISDTLRNILRELAEQEGKPMQKILEKAIEQYRRQCFLEEVNAAYAALRHNPKAWAAMEKERSEWDSTLNDGLEELEDREKWMEDESATQRNKRNKRGKKGG